MELKPRFEYRYEGGPDRLRQGLADSVNRPEASCKGSIRDGFLELALNVEHPPFWAPQLRARILPEGSQTVVRGRFAPKPETWTMFVAVYAAVIFSTGVGAVFGLSQFSLGRSPWALWSLPVGALLIACVWASARIGQQFGAQDMQTLANFVRDSLENEPQA